MRELIGKITGADCSTQEIIITVPSGIRGAVMGAEVKIVPIPPKIESSGETVEHLEITKK